MGFHFSFTGPAKIVNFVVQLIVIQVNNISTGTASFFAKVLSDKLMDVKLVVFLIDFQLEGCITIYHGAF